jgi:hypothetical protein
LATSPLPGRFSLAIAALEERMIQPAVMRLTSNN